MQPRVNSNQIPRIRNVTLKKKFQEFIQVALQKLLVLARETAIPLFPWPKTRITKLSESSSTYKYEFMPNFSQFIASQWDHIREVPEADACIEEMQQDEIISKHLGKFVGTHRSQNHVTAEDCMQHFLDMMVIETKEFDFDNILFERLYLEMDDFFFNEKLKLRIFVPLEGFMASKEVDLGDGIKLIQIITEKLEDILSQYGPFTPLYQQSLRFALEISFEATKIVGKTDEIDSDLRISHLAESESWEPILPKVISALRIFKSGNIAYNSIETSPVGWSMHSGSTRTFGRAHRFIPKGYCLEEIEIQEFKQFWEEFKKFPENSALNRAISRLNIASERARLEDKLVDLMIAFESLFLEEEQELRYRLALRVTALLGHSSSERSKIFKDIYNAYKLRNKIVHGSNKSAISNFITKRNTTLLDFEKRTENLLRKSIKSYPQALSAHKSKKMILRHLDADIVEGFS